MSQPTQRPEPSRQQQLAERRARLSGAQQALLGKWAKRKAGEAPAASVIPRRPAAEPGRGLPLSFAQQRLWFLHQLEPWNPEYHVPAALEARGPLEIAVLRRAFDEVVSRHEILRTRFAEAGDEPVQIVEPPRPRELPVVDLAALPCERRESEQRRLVAAEAVRLFDLARGPLLRTTVLCLGEAEHVLLVHQHHIVSDGWSTGVLVREIGALYTAFSAGRASPLAELPVQYADFALWQRSWLEGEVLERQLAYWRDQLAGVEPLELPTDRPRPAVRSGQGRSLSRLLPARLAEPLEASSREHGVSLFMWLLAAFQALLFRLTGQDDVTVGTPIAGRRWREVEGAIGFFVNTLVMRTEVSPGASFTQLLARVRKSALAAYEHQDVPFEQLVEELRPRRDRRRTPLFQVMLLVQSASVETLEVGGLSLRPLPHDGNTSKFDLLLALEPRTEGLEAGIEYATDLFDRTTVERLARHLETFLDSILENGGEKLGRLALLPPAERFQLLGEYNATATGYPREATVHELFAEQAARTPESVALSWEAPGGGARMSYGELDRRSDRLGHHLRSEWKVGPEVLVGLFMERSPEMVTAVLAILKAGGAYAPFDPGYPQARLAFLVEDTGAPVVLTQGHLAERLPVGTPALCLDTGRLDTGRNETAEAGETPGAATAAGLCYVMYTSGTTGKPKGVAVPHRAVVCLVREASFASLGADEVFLQLAPISFDASTLEIWGALLNGGRLVLHPPGPLSLDELASVLERHRITLLWLTAGLFHQVVEAHPASLASVARVLAGGDVLSVPHVRALLEQRTAPSGGIGGGNTGGGCLVNGYGPTENTTFTCCHVMRDVSGAAAAATVPIGRPIADTTVFLLAEDLEPVPFGVSGELYTGGDGVSRGYFGRASQTAEVFVPDPWSAAAPWGRPGGRLYKTGDRARHLANGDVEFLGRADQQVKVRGFRIELREIEAHLAALPAVARAAAAVREGAGGDKQLVGYVVPAEAGNVPPDAEIRDALAATLPPYMVPRVFVTLEELPLDPNGKVDRRALPAPGAPAAAAAHVAPRTPSEKIVAQIWAEVLGVERPGADDDFFELGGHSLLATRIVSRLRTAHGVRIPVSRVFEASTLAAFAAGLDEAAREDGEAPIEPIEPTTEPPVPSFAQERLWFLDRLDPGTSAYNMPSALRLRGILDPDALEHALNLVLERHAALRTRFDTLDGRPVPVVADSLEVRVPTADLSGLDAAERETRVGRLADEAARRAFDLARGPLLDVRLLRLGPREHVLLLNLHHVAGDGWSVGVLVRELVAGYRSRLEGTAPELPELPIQYADFAAWQRRRLQGAELERQLDWWRQRLAGELPRLELPLDRPRPAVQTYSGGLETRALPPEVAEGLRRLGRRSEASLFMTLAAAFDVLLHRLAGQDDVLVGFPIAGRTRPEVENLIGVFLNTLVLRTDLSRAATFGELLAAVRTETLGAFAHQDVPFEMLLAEIQPQRDLSRTPVFQVLFNMLNLPDVAPRGLPGLTLEMAAEVETPSKFDLTVYASETPDGGMSFNLVYNSDLFDASRAEEMLAQYCRLLEQVAGDPSGEIAIDRLSLVTPAAAERLPDASAPLAAAWRGTIPGRIRERGTPGERPAVADGSETWTCGELLAVSSVLAAEIRRAGLGPGDVVAIDARRSARLVPAILGVLEAGAAFLVLDPSYPAGRRLDLARRARARGWVRLSSDVDPELAAGLGDLVFDVPPRTAPAVPVAGVEVGPDTPAYVAFTSGSTGEPKGIVGGHGPLVHFLDWHTSTFELTAEDRFTLLSGLAHDPLLRDVFTPLWVGATLYVPDPEEIGTPGRLAEWIRTEELSVAHLTPAMGRLLTEGVAAPMPSLRFLFFSGDRLLSRDLERMRELAPRARCVNFYGTTETPQAMGFHVVAEKVPGGVAPVGRGIDGVQLLVRNRAGEPAGIGELGEISVRTPHLARGYLDEPFAGGEYRTGDLGRYRVDGEVDFVGRADGQVQVRGFRVEIGEVEAALRTHPRVTAAAVAWVDGGLAAYVTMTEETRTEESEARHQDLGRYLGRRLPDYMIPRSFAVLDTLPLTPTGKLDRRALASIVPAPAPAAAGGPAPRTPAEEIVAGIFGELLGLDAVPADADFFALGGHSLLATQALARLRDALGVELSVRRIFAAPTVAGLAREVETARHRGTAAPPIVPLPRDEAGLPLSFAQQRLWVLDRLEPGSPAYVMAGALRLVGELDAEALEESLALVVRRHEVLRTRFPAVGGEARQVVEEPSPPAWTRIDLAGVAAPRRRAALESRIAEEIRRPFDLSAGPVLRATLVRLAERGEHALILALHHIVADGWSIGLLSRELGLAYDALAAGTGPDLPELGVQYADYAAWQRRLLEEGVGDLLAHWTEKLAGVPTVLDLPTDRPRPAVQSYRGALLPFSLPGELTDALRASSRRHGVTLFMTLFAGLECVLGRASGQREFLVGTPVAGRGRVELEPLIGLFAGTLVLGADLRGFPPFAELLARVRETALDAYVHQDLPFERLVEALAPRRDLSRTPLFQVMFSLQNMSVESVELEGLTLEPLVADTGTSRFDLFLSAGEVGEGLDATLEYSTDLFDPTTARRLLGRFRTLLEAAVADPLRPCDELPLLGLGERHQLLTEWNDTGRGPAPPRRIHELFEARAAASPEACALVAGGERLSYHELDRRAGHLAARLRGLGVGPESLVGISTERSAAMVAAVLGVLKADGAYLPLDPTFPAERLAFVRRDSAARLVLTEEKLAELSRQPAAPARPRPASGPDHLAYVLYTSGTTGRPKGVAVTHRSAVNFLESMRAAPGLDAGEKLLAVTTLSFDIHVLELFLPLGVGATVVLATREETADGRRLRRRLPDVDVLQATPATWRLLSDAGWSPGETPALRMLCGGEALPRELADRMLERSPELWNLYGPTETTVWSAICRVEPGPGPIHVGRPIDRTSIHVHERRGRPAPAGVPGEVLIGGAGLARGYLGRPALTAEKFVPDPRGRGGRLYRTGDLARWRGDGVLECLGRLDHQVKVRGFRIELGEIETHLLDQPSVVRAVATARRDEQGGEAYLVAYVVTDGGPADAGALREALAARLPPYMVPALVVELPELPLTPNGKVDRKALPAPARVRRGAAVSSPPRDSLELRLARLWEEVLGHGAVGVTDDFFEIGGHSLAAVRLVARVEQELGRELPLAALFRSPTVEQMARALRGEVAPPSPLVALQPAGGAPPLFCVHPAGGNVLVFLPLARALGTNQPFYALQSRGLEDDAEPLARVEEMAELYLAEIRRAFPAGPYRLAGWSFGGLVAYEMARRLAAAGERVALLALLDTAAPVERGDDSLPEEDAFYLAETAAFLARLAGREGALTAEELLALPSEEQTGRFLAALRELGFLPPGAGEVQVRRLLRVYKANLRAKRAYSPAPYDGDLTLLRAGDEAAPPAAEDLGWGRFVAGPVRTHRVRGDHVTLLAGENVDSLAALLREILENER